MAAAHIMGTLQNTRAIYTKCTTSRDNNIMLGILLHTLELLSHEEGPHVDSKMSEVIEEIVKQKSNGKEAPQHKRVQEPAWN